MLIRENFVVIEHQLKSAGMSLIEFFEQRLNFC